jgi:hypothetical protein
MLLCDNTAVRGDVKGEQKIALFCVCENKSVNLNIKITLGISIELCFNLMCFLPTCHVRHVP